MIDLAPLQKRIYANKTSKGFNVTDVPKEFAYLYGEVAEAFDAYSKKQENVGEELADVAIYLLGLCEILGIDLETELMEKIEKNEKRKYVVDANGILQKIENE